MKLRKHLISYSLMYYTTPANRSRASSIFSKYIWVDINKKITESFIHELERDMQTAGLHTFDGIYTSIIILSIVPLDDWKDE